MSNSRSRRSIALVAIIAIILVAMCSWTIADGVSMADSSQNITQLDSLTIGHMSDIHYFPLQYCYQDVNNANYLSSDFYDSMTGDTKLVLESGLILNQQVQSFIEDGQNGIAPQYLFASGDLCKNGEHGALIDVANALRYLQNEMRKIAGYENFQVFAMVGNHDLYNTDGAYYSALDGSKRNADAVSSAEFALIFAGLGFPEANLTGENGAINLTDYLPAEYWSSSYTSGYQASTLASNVKISYYSAQLEAVGDESTSQAKLEHYFDIGDSLHSLSYTVELVDRDYAFAVIDATDRESLEIGAIVRVGEKEFDHIKSGSHTYFLEDAEGYIDSAHPITSVQQIESAFAEGKNVYRATGYSHYTGGRIQETCIDWVEQFANAQNANASVGGEKTLVAVFHQNLLPHWEEEDEILKDFTLYNWEYATKRFLQMGVRYALTGHMHASDLMTYTDIEGRTMYDFETGSCVSFSSPRRYLQLIRQDCDGVLGEEVISSIHSIDDLKEVASDNIFACDGWNQSAYDSAMAIYTANPNATTWEGVLNSNPAYLTYIIRYDELSVLNLDQFISKDLYSILADRVVGHFISDGIVDTVKNLVSNVILDGGTAINMVASMLTGNKTSLNGLVQYLIDTIFYDLYPDTDGDGTADYMYNGVGYDGALDYVRAIVDTVLNFEYGDESLQSALNPTNAGKMNVKDIASFIVTSHGAGTEISFDETYESIDAQFDEVACGDNHFAYKLPYDKTFRKRMLAAMQDMHEQMLNGKFVKDLLDTLLNPLFVNDDSLLKTLFAHSFDFNDAVAKGYITQANYNKLAENLANLPELISQPFVQNLISNLLGVEITLPEGMTIQADNFVLQDIVNSVLPLVKTLVANLIGFNLEGPDIITMVQNVLDDYLTDSFYVGIGGIVDGIIVAFATDVCPDLADNANPLAPFTVQEDSNCTYANHNLAYLASAKHISTVGGVNPATQDNGRVPSRVTSNFDTKDSQTTYTIKFYTEEFVYGTLRILDESGNIVLEVQTNRSDALNAYALEKTDYMDIVSSASANGIVATMLTQTKPAYVPFIDLGLLCLTHGEVYYTLEDSKEELPRLYGQRDLADKNSVIYWNVSTVTITGLEAGKSYRFDLLGNYEDSNGDTQYFSLANYAQLNGYDKDYFTLATAVDSTVTDFEFLTIADIQGMIQSMYQDSHSAVDALLGDSRTNTFDFILNAGDMCDNGKNFNQWAYALDTYQDLFVNTSMFFTAGNHENGTNALETYFNYTLPTDDDGERLQADVTDGMFYSFDYANAHFVVLNTNDASASGLGNVQLEWLKSDLANSTAKWKFVLMHKSLFSGGSHSTDAEVVAMREQLVPIFAQYGVNMVFAGHDHTYTSTYLVDGNGNCVDKSDLSGVQYTGDGVLYITLGTLGTKFYEYGENADVTPKFDSDKSILDTLTTQTFGKVVVSGDTLTYTGYTYNRETNTIEVVGQSVLSANKVLYKSTVIAISVCVPLIVIAGGAFVGLYIYLKKSGKIAKKAVKAVKEVASDEQA